MPNPTERDRERARTLLEVPLANGGLPVADQLSYPDGVSFVELVAAALAEQRAAHELLALRKRDEFRAQSLLASEACDKIAAAIRSGGTNGKP